jgi:triacylglycerol lipase
MGVPVIQTRSRLPLVDPITATKAAVHAFHFQGTVLNNGCKHGCRWRRADSSRLPWDPDLGYGGWGGTTRMPCTGVERTPVVFVHGNQRDACDWERHRAYFRNRGYSDDELWAITFAQATPTHDEIAAQLEDFVENVRTYTNSQQVTLVTHSLGVTGARHWLSTADRFDWIEAFVGISGANHGVDSARLCCRLGINRGPYRTSQFLRSDYETREDHPLRRLNEDETPGDVRYYTIRGTEDILFRDHPDSPALEGADENLILPTDHDGTRDDPVAIEAMHDWARESAASGAEAPETEAPETEAPETEAPETEAPEAELA